MLFHRQVQVHLLDIMKSKGGKTDARRETKLDIPKPYKIDHTSRIVIQIKKETKTLVLES